VIRRCVCLSADAAGALVVVLHVCSAEGRLGYSWVLRSISVEEEFEFGRRSVGAFRLSFGLRYARRGDRKRWREQKESGRWALNVER
jgi:hypothetical protein